MQKSDIIDDRIKVISNDNTPKKNSSIKIIKSPIRVMKKENPESSINLNKSKLLKNLPKNNFIENDKKINNIENSNLEIYKLEEENSKNNFLIKNIINYNSIDLEKNSIISPSENLNKNKNNNEMLDEKNLKERNQKYFLGNLTDLNDRDHIDVKIEISENSIEKGLESNLLKIETKVESNSNSKIRNIRDLKIDSNKNIIPPNNMNNFKEIYKKEIEKNDDLKAKYEDNLTNLDDLDYVKISNAKKKKEWKSWSLSEKELFYEAIANGANYTSLQKLFKNMNDVRYDIIS